MSRDLFERQAEQRALSQRFGLLARNLGQKSAQERAPALGLRVVRLRRLCLAIDEQRQVFLSFSMTSRPPPRTERDARRNSAGVTCWVTLAAEGTERINQRYQGLLYRVVDVGVLAAQNLAHGAGYRWLDEPDDLRRRIQIASSCGINGRDGARAFQLA